MGTASLALHVEPFVVTPEFSETYRQYADLVFRAAYRVTGSAADAEDVLQTVFLRILSRDEHLDGARNREAYFRRSATNAAIDVLRRRAARPEGPVDDRLTAHEASPLLKERLRRAIAQLPPRDAELFSLRYIEGLSNIELAELFDMERATVATRLHRIRLTLQESL